ncbi:MAG: hypothetical protein WCY92_13540 [Novosphingobium sp.]
MVDYMTNFEGRWNPVVPGLARRGGFALRRMAAASAERIANP